MSTSTRYSLRLRPRGGNGDDNDTAAPAGGVTSRTRSALGNISNRDGSDDAELISKKTKPAGGTAAERGRTGRATRSARAKEEANAVTEQREEKEEEKKPLARRSSSRTRTSSRVASAVAAVAGKRKKKGAASEEDDEATAKTVAAKKKESAAAAAKSKKDSAAASKKKQAAAKKETAAAAKKKKSEEETKPKKSGKKRSSSDGGNAAKPAKRARKSADSSTAAATDKPANARRSSSRSRSKSATTTTRRRASTSSSASTRSRKKKSATSRGVVVDIIPAPSEDRIIPADFGLQRESFDGSNFTYGIAHYDEPDRNDPNLCKDYITDMFQQLYQAETKYLLEPYMHRQDDINEKMRAILIDWLVEVHMKFRLVPSTLYLCVHIIDRYCSSADVPRTKLQLVGVTALFLACKHEEIYPPEVRDCVYITDRAYDRQEVLDMEQTILRVLNWKISLPTAYPFLDRFLRLTKASEMTKHAATYYLERTLQEHDLLRFRPSMVCASAVILALNNPDIRKKEEEPDRVLPGLPKILMEYTEFDKEELMKCMALVATKVCEPTVSASKRQLVAVKKKYQNPKYLSVSTELELPSTLFVRQNEESS